MQCDMCQRRAVIFQQYSGLRLCGQHFTAGLEAKAKRAIRTHRWLKRDDHIAVALSGRDDESSALLFFLKKLTSGRRDITVSAVTIDEGIGNYSAPARAAGIAESMGAEYVTASFKEEYGTGMDGIAAKRGDGVACSYCRAMRSSLLNRVARDHGITKLATGYNLDDGALSVLTGMLQGDAARLLCKRGEDAGIVPHIHPFMYIPEREVGLYSRLQNAGGLKRRQCPYAGDTLMSDVKNTLNSYTLRHPSTKYSLVSLGERLSESGSMVKGEIRACGVCGEPCNGTCRSCEILQEVTLDAA